MKGQSTEYAQSGNGQVLAGEGGGCELQLRDQIHSPYFISTPICTLWGSLTTFLLGTISVLKKNTHQGRLGGRSVPMPITQRRATIVSRLAENSGNNSKIPLIWLDCPLVQNLFPSVTRKFTSVWGIIEDSQVISQNEDLVQKSFLLFYILLFLITGGVLL